VRLQSLMSLPRAYFRSKRILQEFKPDIVVGIGGYASGPMTLAAHFQKIFTAIIEQNSYPGLTNRTLGRFVDKIFIAFKRAEKFFDTKKTFLTGNPVRKFTPPPVSKPERPFTVFILGGSQGAHALNVAIKEALPLLEEKKNQLYFIHQTGPQDFEDVQSWYQRQGFSGDVFPFRSDLEQAYQKAHLALCRAGAGTITELRLQGLPAILVPYPYATDDHQKFNAEELVDQGAAELCLNQNLNGVFVAQRIEYFLEHPEELQVMGNQALAQAKPHAAQEVLKLCLSALSSRGPKGRSDLSHTS
jgi:UDP-N-acetylglucosamine--N-acetylmuramyl-(pentapeptide) pyrophosphoryl-undecaprenol N-acetylglucosamine transferase